MTKVTEEVQQGNMPQIHFSSQLSFSYTKRIVQSLFQDSLLLQRKSKDRIVFWLGKRYLNMASMKTANRLKVAFDEAKGPSMGCW